MRLLHTSDWHIGRTLYGRKRYEEFEAFLQWLADQVREREITTLLVAGDIFDTSVPSNRAQALYYRFLCQVATSACRHVVVVAGNHDSPSFLNAPRELLRALNVHVIGNASDDPDAEVTALDEAVQHAEKAEQEARAELTGSREQLTTANTQANTLRERISLRTLELAKGEVQFETALTGAQFSGEVQFQQARLSPEERTALEAAAKDLETRQTQLQTSLRDRTSQLEQEENKHITDKPLDALLPESEALQAQHRDLLSAVATLKRDLQKNDEAKALLFDKQGEIDAQTEECRRWDNLHALIGSADGKKYRNFTQGLTFEMMVGHANRQLQKMSDRYLLVRDPGQPLELNVVDNYQAAEVRSTKNLSGGESFIVSLSLALGLSQMASRNVRVDSLFLDEGFGTLDEEALDTALETLSGLQQEGKLIGVISHVQALKERISTQIQVTPQTGGTSQVAGPGCDQVSATE